MRFNQRKDQKRPVAQPPERTQKAIGNEDIDSSDRVPRAGRSHQGMRSHDLTPPCPALSTGGPSDTSGKWLWSQVAPAKS